VPIDNLVIDGAYQREKTLDGRTYSNPQDSRQIIPLVKVCSKFCVATRRTVAGSAIIRRSAPGTHLPPKDFVVFQVGFGRP